MKNVAAILLFAVAISCVGSSSASADPIPITGGSASVGASVAGIPGGPFHLVSDVFDLNGHMDGGWSAAPFLAGNTATILVLNGGQSLRDGSGVVNGVSYDHFFYEGLLRFTGSFVVPDSAAEQFSVFVPFNLTGFLQACTTSTFVSACTPSNLIFESAIEGTGVATVNMTNVQNPTFGRLVEARSVTFDVTSAPKPTPEPASLLLITVGAAVLARRLRRT